MREIHDHKLTGLNEALVLAATDAPGPGGANHEYEVRLVLPGNNASADSPHCTPSTNVVKARLSFQNGPVAEGGANGISNEVLLAILIDRLRGFQHQRVFPNASVGENPSGTQDLGFDFNSRGKYACRENAVALTHLEDALMWLQKRTRERTARGVEGTSKV